MSARARSLVLVEGQSDRAAVETLARRLGRDLDREGVHVVALGGATNVGRFLEENAAPESGVRLAGLYDAKEERYFRRGLERAGHGDVPDRDRLEDLGFFACVDDLEDELIRALGVPTVESVIQEQGELASLRILQHQPAQRSRTNEQHLHRFLGTRAGRKSAYAELLVDALELDHMPRPLTAVLARTLV